MSDVTASCRSSRTIVRLLALAAVLALAAAACASDGGDEAGGVGATDTGTASEAGSATGGDAESSETPATQDESNDDDARNQDDDEAGGQDGEGDGDFPVTLEQQIGSVTIPAEPERIFVLDDWSFDYLTALGVQPIGATLFTPPSSWVSGPVVEATPITQLAAELPLEAIAAENPDLLIDAGGFHTWDPDMAERLKAIAPTLSPVTGAEVDSWQTTLRHIAAAVGRSNEGEAQITQTTEQIAQVVADNPEIAGARLTIARWNPLNSTYAMISSPDDVVRQFLNGQLGFVTPQAQLDAIESGGAELLGQTLEVSEEEFDLAGDGADVIIMSVTGGDPAPLLENPIWQSQDFVADGRVVYVDEEAIIALIAPSPRSIGFVLDTVVPEVVAVLNG
ncbi:MAG: ABC transporter substrate-binding protein [Actinomycetota bacterium]